MSSICPTGRFNIVAVPSLKPIEVATASCGAEHSVVLTKVITHELLSHIRAIPAVSPLVS
jgi:hypothetical protein